MDKEAIIGFAVLGVIIAAPIILKLMGVGAKRVAMKNPATGQLKTGFYGFSWTYLFFGFLVPVIRGELGVGALHLLFSFVTLGLWQLILPFLYNKQYTQRLIEKGYKFIGSELENTEAARRIGIDLGTHLART